MFICALCGREFEKTRPEEEAVAELRRVFGSVPVEECAIVCDGCYKMLVLAKKYEIWSEGFVASGQYSRATFHGRAEGNSFRDACISFAQKNPDFAKYFRPNDLAFWGCRLFDNEKDARRFEEEHIDNRDIQI